MSDHQQTDVAPTDPALVHAIRMAVIAWNTLGPRKVGEDVSQFIADWLTENAVNMPDLGGGDER